MSEENVLTMELTPVVAQKILKEIIDNNSERVFFTTHAENRMSSRNITRPQVCCCLKHGQFFEEPFRSTNRNWQMTLEVFSAGESIKISCALDNDSSGNYIIVITAI